jgi:hypothetical protein
MNKFTIPLTLLAAATLACRSQKSEGEAPETFDSPVPANELRMGKGKIVVLWIRPVRWTPPWQRMTLRMEDGTTRIVDRRSPGAWRA